MSRATAASRAAAVGRRHAILLLRSPSCVNRARFDSSSFNRSGTALLVVRSVVRGIAAETRRGMRRDKCRHRHRHTGHWGCRRRRALDITIIAVAWRCVAGLLCEALRPRAGGGRTWQRYAFFADHPPPAAPCAFAFALIARRIWQYMTS